MLKYGFFNSVEGDRTYSADDLSSLYEGLLSNGVVRGVGDEMVVDPGSGMKVRVNTGKAFIGGKWIKNTGPYSLDVNPADTVYRRIDLVVARIKMSERKVELIVKPGTPGPSNLAPGYTQTTEIPLAKITIPANATSISDDMIQDYRVYASIQNISNGRKCYVSTNAIYANIQQNALPMEDALSKRNGEVRIDVLEINGSTLVNVMAGMDQIEVPGSGSGYLIVKILMPKDLGSMEKYTYPMIGSGGLRIVQCLKTDDRFVIALENTKDKKDFFTSIEMSFMDKGDAEVRTY